MKNEFLKFIKLCMNEIKKYQPEHYMEYIGEHNYLKIINTQQRYEFMRQKDLHSYINARKRAGLL